MACAAAAADEETDVTSESRTVDWVSYLLHLLHLKSSEHDD